FSVGRTASTGSVFGQRQQVEVSVAVGQFPTCGNSRKNSRLRMVMCFEQLQADDHCYMSRIFSSRRAFMSANQCPRVAAGNSILPMGFSLPNRWLFSGYRTAERSTPFAMLIYSLRPCPERRLP